MKEALPEVFVFVSVKGSAYVYSVITKKYFEILQTKRALAPDDVYADSEYAEFSCPFTFTSLTEQLPFKMTDFGRFRMRAFDGIPSRDSRLLEFHRECLAVYKKFDLSVDKLWFEYVKDGREYSLAFQAAHDRLSP